MKKFGIILSISLIGTIILSVLFSSSIFGSNIMNITTIAATFGIVALSIGVLEIITGFILLFTHLKATGQSLLLSGVILIVIGFSTCFGALNRLQLN